MKRTFIAKPKTITASKYDYIDEFLEELAYETCDLEEEFNENEWKEFKELCKENGYPRVTKRDFAIYLDKVKDIRSNDFDEDDYYEGDIEGSRTITASKQSGVRLKVIFEPYDRYERSGLKTKIVKGEDLVDAIWNVADMLWYTLDGDDPEELIESLKEQNGDGNDYIRLLQNADTKEVYIEEGYEEINSSEDIQGEFELVRQPDLDVDLPDRIILTDNGSYDLEKQGMNGIYTWVGYRHKGSRSDSKMAREVKNVAYNIVAPALAEYASMPEENVHVEDYLDKADMFRVWIECP